MVDRVLHMVKSLGSLGHSRELLEEAADYYTSYGYSDTVRYLTQEKGLSEPAARELAGGMEREDVRLNREVLLFYSIILFIFLFVFIVAIWSGSYFFSLIPGFFLIRSLLRVIRFLRSHQLVRTKS